MTRGATWTTPEILQARSPSTSNKLAVVKVNIFHSPARSSTASKLPDIAEASTDPAQRTVMQITTSNLRAMVIAAAANLHLLF
jgi:hypothetical protein